MEKQKKGIDLKYPFRPLPGTSFIVNNENVNYYYMDISFSGFHITSSGLDLYGS
jgi:hypothetical protein